jgi:hypothetical protein
MNKDIQTYLDLVDKLAKFRKSRDKLLGAIEQLKQSLEKGFGFNTIKEAKEESKRLDMVEKDLSIKFNQLLKEFENEFDHLSGDSK